MNEPPPEPDAPNLDVEITIDAQVHAPIHSSLITQAARAAAIQQGFHRGELGVRITDDETIKQINAKHLGHDYATDVISFGYSAEGSTIQGELVASVDTARARSSELGWSIDYELALYVVHGVLHITGLDDHNDKDRAEMRRCETEVMTSLGINDIVRFGVDTNEGDSE
ncbi:Endoribonuclease YbeY [Rubripirellula obstinata]|uniref:Endoribonuclease YbeY n=1 Tax=Rubripirellula obstinata TaxID=406547 RepID=A0A5B1CQA2_9BACT|nr:rRNA maturation RNase YbeY [Rubripirellula obstinata]KAA1262155.1 Endoribonuclease YbeY [Rubripirellula obstinata]